MKIPDNSIAGVIFYLNEQLASLFSSSELRQITKTAFEHFLNMSEVDLVMSAEKRCSESELLKFIYLVKDLKKGRPLQYILGDTEFYGYTFKVNQEVLIPRPETEELCEWIISKHQNEAPSILDIGTGSGCIAITLKKNIKKAQVSGCDLSSRALDVAIFNAKKNKVDVNFFKLDILNDAKKLAQNAFDVIVSNPPYVLRSDKKNMAKNVVKYEPDMALFVPTRNPLLFYKVIAKTSLDALKPGGRLFFEIHEKYGNQIVELLETLGYAQVELRKDIADKDRMIMARR